MPKRTPIDSIQQLLKAGQLEEALAAAEQALRKEPKNVELLLWKSVALRSLDQTDDAIEVVDWAAKLDPRNDLVWFTRATIWEARGEFDKAIADYSRAIQISPVNSEYYWRRGNVYDVLSANEQAIRDFDLALGFGGKRVDILRARAIKYWMSDQTPNALADLDEAVKLAPDDLDVRRDRIDITWLMVFGSRKARKNPQLTRQVLGDCDIILRREPHELKIKMVRLNIFRDLARYDDVLNEANELLQIKDSLPSDDKTISWSTVYCEKATELARRGEFAAAISFLEEGNRLSDDKHQRQTLAEWYFKIGDFKKCILECDTLWDRIKGEEGDERRYDEDRLRSVRALAWCRIGEYRKALADLTWLLENDSSNDPKVLNARAECYDAIGKAGLAQKDRAEAKRLEILAEQEGVLDIEALLDEMDDET